MEQPDAAAEVTLLLQRWAEGDKDALERVAQLLYPQLQNIARGYFRRERSGHTLQPTALVNEAYLLLEKIRPYGFENRNEFLSLVAQLMRRILVSHARKARTGKRGGGMERVNSEISSPAEDSSVEEFLLLEDALLRLSNHSTRKAEIIELRYFGGLTLEEAGKVLGISTATVFREERMAEAWLSRELGKATPPAP